MSLRNLIEQISEELQKAYKTGAAYQHLQDMKQRYGAVEQDKLHMCICIYYSFSIFYSQIRGEI